MNNQDNLIIAQDDFQNISSLIKNARREIAEPLEEELERATIVANEDLPSDVVAMNCQVVFKDMDSNKETTAILVYPQDVNTEENKISILSPIGSALIGLRAGQLIEWDLPNGKSKKLMVISVARSIGTKSKHV